MSSDAVPPVWADPVRPSSEIDLLVRRCAADPRVLGFAGGLPASQLFPRSALTRAFLEVIRSPEGGGLQYGWPEGSHTLRVMIADRLRARGANVSEDDVIVTNGAQQALAIATELLLDPAPTPPNGAPATGIRPSPRDDLIETARTPRGICAAVEVDAETYPAALELFRARGAPLLVRSVASAPPPFCVAAYAMPGVANPRGNGLSDAIRSALLGRGGYVLADEAYAELRFDGQTPRPLIADAPDRVFHVGTFSKTLCPGLRVGFLLPPRAFRRDALRRKQAADLEAGNLAQAVLSRFLAHDDFDARLIRARRFYRARADRLLGDLHRRFPSFVIGEPEGGFSVFVETGEPGDDAAFLRVAADHGVTFDPGRLFRSHTQGSPLAFRLCYSALRATQFPEAVARLARAYAVFRGKRAA